MSDVLAIAPAEIAREFQQCEVPSQELIAAGIRDGISWDLIARRVELALDGGLAFAGPRMTRVIAFEDGRFEFASAIGGPGALALLFVAYEEAGEPLDLVAWVAGKPPLTWLGRASLLGAESLAAYRPFDEPCTVHFSMLEYLRHACSGVLVLDAQRAGERLRWCSSLRVKSREDRSRLQWLLKPRSPRIELAPR
jgi:hypothetical protein